MAQIAVMKILSTLLPLLSLSFILSCSSSLSDKELRAPDQKKEEAVADTAMLVKTASVNCKVKDVKSASSQISITVKKLNGLITHQRLDINEAGEKRVRISKDSVQVIKILRPELAVTARIPSEDLEDFIAFATSLSYNVSHTQMDVEDMRLSYLKNKLEQQNRTVVSNKDMRRDSSRLSDMQQLDILDDISEKKISNYKIAGDVQYSTINLGFYQPDIVTKETVANTNLDEFQLPFSTRLAAAFSGGVEIIKEMMIGLAYLWIMILFAMAAFMLYRKFRQLPKINLRK